MPQPFIPVVPPPSPTLSVSQLATLRGWARSAPPRSARCSTASVIATIRSSRSSRARSRFSTPAGNEIVRHGASGFLGELNLLSGQTVFVTAVVTKPLALHRGRPRSAAIAPVRGRATRRRRALGVHRAARSAAAGPGTRARDRRAAFVHARRCGCSTSRAATDCR